MKTIGLIAGWGELPKIIGDEARQKGHAVFAVGLEPLVDTKLKKHVDDIEFINVGKLGKIIASLRKAGITEAVLAGKVPKSLLYERRIVPYLRAAKVLMTLRDNKDDTIMTAFTNELEKEGIKLLKTTSFTERIMAQGGVMTKRKPKKHHMKDIEFGMPLAKEMGRLDIGQTVVIKDRAVMAVEAIEGTDKTIKRGGKLAGDDAVVIKVAKPGQDLRFDVPGVGRKTILIMAEVEASVLALEAGACIIMDKEMVLEEADELGISIVGVQWNK